MQKEFKPSNIINNMKKKEFVNAYAYDPKVGRMVVHVVFANGRAVSLVSGREFKVGNKELKKIMSYEPKK